MEIQDRNSLLQQLFSAKAFGTSAVPSADTGFADMLKPTESEKDEEGCMASVDFRTSKTAEKNISAQKPKTVLKDSKKDAVEDKKTPASENKKVKHNKSEQNVKEETGVAAVDKTGEQISQPEETATEENSVPAADENVSSETSVELTEGAVSPQSAAPVLSPLGFVDADTEISASVFVPETPVVMEETPAVETLTPVAVVSEVAAADINVPSEDEAETQTPVQTESPLTEEEALLLEQAKYLDEKIAAPEKMKIEVSVKGEKIAEPVVKDVLQNRFEVDSLFQSVDAETALPHTDTVQNSDISISALAKPISSEAVTAVNNPVAFAGAQISGETGAKPTTDISDMTVSGKEVAFETGNVMRSETFARINETSSRDAFKGMGKEIVEQIKVNITKSAVKGIDTIDIQLKPEDLGKIQIKMHIARDGRLQAEIVSARAETLDLLQKDVSSLVKAFNDAGYEADNRSFNFSFQEENQARGQQKDESGLLTFIGDALEQEAENAAGNDNLGYDPLLGLNIRV